MKGLLCTWTKSFDMYIIILEGEMLLFPSSLWCGQCTPLAYFTSMRVANDRWLMLAGQVVLCTWLFSTSFEEDALWWALTRYKEIFT